MDKRKMKENEERQTLEAKDSRVCVPSKRRSSKSFRKTCGSYFACAFVTRFRVPNLTPGPMSDSEQDKLKERK